MFQSKWQSGKSPRKTLPRNLLSHHPLAKGGDWRDLILKPGKGRTGYLQLEFGLSTTQVVDFERAGSLSASWLPITVTQVDGFERREAYR